MSPTAPRRNVVDRAFEVAEATLPKAPQDDLAHPFGFDVHPPHMWRVSRDVWHELIAHTDKGPLYEPEEDDRLLGEPIVIDEALPPNSMLLEPIGRWPYEPGSLEVTIR